MAAPNEFRVTVEALDSSQGYLLRGRWTVNSALTQIDEHYQLEADVRTRLQTGFDAWAAQVDSE